MGGITKAHEKFWGLLYMFPLLIVMMVSQVCTRQNLLHYTCKIHAIYCMLIVLL